MQQPIKCGNQLKLNMQLTSRKQQITRTSLLCIADLSLLSAWIPELCFTCTMWNNIVVPRKILVIQWYLKRYLGFSDLFSPGIHCLVSFISKEKPSDCYIYWSFWGYWSVIFKTMYVFISWCRIFICFRRTV